MEIFITRNGPTQKGMYEIGEVEHGGGVTPHSVNTDVQLCQRLRSAGITEAMINDIVLVHLQHKQDFAHLVRQLSGEWTVAFGNRKNS
jgi:hypothetical protein